MKWRLLWAWYGVLATLVGIGIAHLVASLADPSSSPVLAVGSGVIDLTPTPMKDWAIRTFGSPDKVILLGSVMIGVLVLAAVAGILARSRPRVGAAMLGVLIVVPLVAVLTRPRVEALDVLPTLVAAAIGPAALLLLARTHQR
ncbi:MAG: oxidoreductase, partial [Nocardioidaceae bacterium]|nr:oxidoreductase [Nocardioidaceae bacterium]